MNYSKEIIALKQNLGDRITIPGHHYQIPEIVKLVDFVGDSYKLAVDCSKTDSEFIIFCGVKFMAEGAALLGKPDQKVIMPVTTAGCPLADYIDAEKAESVLNKIAQSSISDIAPVFYMNSYIDAKSVCGKYEGAVCTSSNAAKIVKHFLDKGKSVFFAPDFNLGINTADQLQLQEDQIVRIDLDLSFDKKISEKTRLFIWNGNCRVHKRFTIGDLQDKREQFPDAKIIVHPECGRELVKNSDMAGSTQMIYNQIKKSASGSTWIVGTEYHFVERLNREFADKTVLPLKKSICYNMAKTTLKNLYETISNVAAYTKGEEELKNQITIDPKQAANAKLALKKMIEITEG